MVGMIALPAMVTANTNSAPTRGALQHARFVENKGQWNSEATFRLEAPGQDLWVTKSGVVIDFHRTASSGFAAATNRNASASRVRTGHVVKVDFVGASNAVRPVGVGAGTALRNWIRPDQVINGVREFREARLVNVVPGVTARYYVEGDAPRYDAILAPGTDPNSVTLNYQGANNLRISADGTLMYDTVLGTVKEQRLFVYQDVNGVRQPVEAAFRLAGKNRVGFTLGRYDASKPVTIDPQIMAAWTFLPNVDAFTSIDRHNGQLIVAGATTSTTYPTTAGAYSTTYSGETDFVLTRLRQSLTSSAIVYSTYFGSTDFEPAFLGSPTARFMANGDVILAASTRGTLPTPGGFKTSPQAADVYVARLNGTLGTVKHGSYFGGAGDEYLTDADINPQNGDVALGMLTDSVDMSSAGMVVGASSVSSRTFAFQGGFVAVVNSRLNGVQMGTYVHNETADVLESVAYGRDYQTVLFGGSVGTKRGAPSLTPNFGSFGGGGRGAYIGRLRLGNGTENGRRLALHAFASAGSSDAVVYDIAVDMLNDRPIVTGHTYFDFGSDNFATLASGAPGFDQAAGGASSQRRGYVMRFKPELDRITGWTYLRSTDLSTSSEAGQRVAVQSNGTIHIAGFSSSGSYPLVNTQLTNLPNSQEFGSPQSFVTRVSNGFAHIGSSLFGSNVNSIVLDGPYNDLYFLGTAYKGFTPITIPGHTPFIGSFTGPQDGFVARMAFFTDPILLESSRTSIASGQTVSLRVTLNAPVVSPSGQNVTFTCSSPGVFDFGGGAGSVLINIPRGSRRGIVEARALPGPNQTVNLLAISSGTTLTRSITVNNP
ncbi:MAG: hypothetical protein SFX74_00170 [Fimbriimonadaceae bacterium]|nr:hypothetical protein [Fimbriimonadaceae bacterium]